MLLARALLAEKENLLESVPAEMNLLFPEWKGLDGITLSPSGWLVSLGDDDIFRAQLLPQGLIG